MTEAVNNAKQVFYLLVEFDSDYGEFPSDATAALIVHEGSNVHEGLLVGEHSNAYMRQFIAGGYTNSEEIFYAKINGAKKPDNVISPPEKILEAGECGFAYVKSQSTSNNSGRPILISGMLGEGLKFDPDVFEGKAVVLRVDGAVKQLLINEDGQALNDEGKTLFQPGPDSVWDKGGFGPSMIVFPEIKK